MGQISEKTEQLKSEDLLAPFRSKLSILFLVEKSSDLKNQTNKKNAPKQKTQPLPTHCGRNSCFVIPVLINIIIINVPFSSSVA